MAVKLLSEVYEHTCSALPPNAVPFRITTRTLPRIPHIPAVELPIRRAEKEDGGNLCTCMWVSYD